MDRIEEIFVPESITTVDGLMAFLVGEIRRRGGDPTKLRMLNTETAIPNVQFSEEWPCWTLQFDVDDSAAYRQAKGE